MWSKADLQLGSRDKDMKRIRSFLLAVVMLAVFATSVHAVTQTLPLKVENGRFGFWFNPYKDMSYAALSENIKDNTVLLMGSSEFRHGRKTEFHPRNVLAIDKYDFLAIGGPGNQILFHTIATGALEKKLKKRKVILLVSPSWFSKDGVTKTNYGMRFSETEYIKFLENDRIDAKTKEYVANRSFSLLEGNSRYSSRIKLINNRLVGGKSDVMTKAFFGIEKAFASDRDKVTAAVAIESIAGKPNIEMKNGGLSEEQFDELEKQAEMRNGRRSSNPFYMSDKIWKRRFNKTYAKDKDAYPKRIRENSPEFGDLEAFLDVCRSTGIRAKFIILPVNGRWFDYIGTVSKDRRAVVDKIKRIAEKNSAAVADLSNYDYEPFITNDVTHPWGKGWILIDREIYRFCGEGGN